MTESNYAYAYQSRGEMLEFIPMDSRRILEVGCGDGSFASQLAQRGEVELWGVEIHRESADIAATRMHRVICGDFEKAIDEELPQGYFDCIVFNDALEHFPYHDRVLNNIKKLLVPNGIVVTSLPNFRYVGNLWEILLEKEFRYKSFGILDYTHFRFFTLKSIRRTFTEQGYEVLLIQGIKPTRSIKVRLFILLTLGFFSDIPFMQIATVARLKS
jgi:2-polyprenyl-3-methyl-5-hydroxy-6-metoxy-1,4-benzoquinol methylase